MLWNTKLRDGVRDAYSAVAERPQDKHPFPVGRNFAESVGYDGSLLNKLPSSAIEAFTGVSNVSIIADIPAGSTVLDLGCGAGLDSLIAALRTGPDGKVIGIDFSETMISRARQAFTVSGFDNGEFRIADAENLPVEDNSIDVALVNGIFNLSPDRGAVFLHLARVLKEDGSVYVAELILNGSQPQNAQCDLTNWFAWIAGAKDGDTFLREFYDAGFREAALLRTFQNERTKNPHVIAAEFHARTWQPFIHYGGTNAMSAILKLIINEPRGGRWKANIIAAGKVAKDFDINIVTIPKNKAGDNAKAPSVYLDDKVLAEIGGKRDGKITENELIIELARERIPGKAGI